LKRWVGNRSLLWRVTKISAGSLLVLLGLVGLLLPVLQGILFLVLGLGLLSTEIPWLRDKRDRLMAWRRARRERARLGAVPEEEA